MPGYDRERIVDVSKEELEEFICGICHAIFKNPVMTNCCRQTYCLECITQWLNEKNTCPNDRERLSIRAMSSVPRAFNNLLGKFKIKCDNEMEGCKAQIQISGLENHLKTCEFIPNVECKRCGIERESNLTHDCIKSLLKGKDELIIENKRISIDRDQKLRKYEIELKKAKKQFVEMRFELEKEMVKFRDDIIQMNNTFFNNLMAKMSQNFEKIIIEYRNSIRSIEIRSMESIEKNIIEICRINIDDVHFEINLKFSHSLRDSLLDITKEAILHNSNFNEIEEYILERLLNSSDFGKFPWMVIVEQRKDKDKNLIDSSQFRFYLRIRFFSLIVSISCIVV